MSSGFVSGGTVDQPAERDEAWRLAQQEIEEARRAKQELSRQTDGKSLYEVLQQNKAAKQEAFEESTRLKNQFRSLDEDEVDFLDTVLESTRAKEQAVMQETAAQLELFREQQEEAKQALLLPGSPPTSSANLINVDGSPQEEISWAPAAKKRKRSKEKEILRGVKTRKSAPASGRSSFPKEVSQSTETGQLHALAEKVNGSATKHDGTDEEEAIEQSAGLRQKHTQKGSGLGLGSYGSDDDD